MALGGQSDLGVMLVEMWAFCADIFRHAEHSLCGVTRRT